jgi:hypothetical protein
MSGQSAGFHATARRAQALRRPIANARSMVCRQVEKMTEMRQDWTMSIGTSRWATSTSGHTSKTRRQLSG